LPNVRAALAWALGRGEIETGLRLTSGLSFVWAAAGRFREGRESLDRLPRLSQGISPLRLIKVLVTAASLARAQGDSAYASTVHARVEPLLPDLTEARLTAHPVRSPTLPAHSHPDVEYDRNDRKVA
jgi:hypothetical protein